MSFKSKLDQEALDKRIKVLFQDATPEELQEQVGKSYLSMDEGLTTDTAVSAEADSSDKDEKDQE